MRATFSSENTMGGVVTLMTQAMEFLQAGGLNARSLYIAELALEEMLTNTVKYGYDDAESHRMELGAEVTEGRVSLDFEDDGHFFDPTQAAVPHPEGATVQRKPGGYGIQLVRKLVEEFAYRREGARNHLHLGFPAQAEKPAAG